MSRFAARVLPLAITILLAASAHAQEEHQSAVPERETRSQEAAQQAAQTAAAQAAFIEETVTYDQILADPDNLSLNFRYAKAQIARGDLLGASASLERILLVNPEYHDARLTYAIVLQRLGNLDEARREFLALRELPLPASAKADVDAALRQIARQKQRTHATFSTTMGWGYDRNRNAAPSKILLVTDTATGLTGTNRRRHDTSFLGIQTLEVAHDLGTQAGHQALGSFTHFLGEQTRVDDLDLEQYAGELGGQLRTPWLWITPMAVYEHLRLSRETYLRSHGTRIAYERAVMPRLSLQGNTDWMRENFSGISESAAAFERTGSRIILDGGATYTLTPTMQLAGTIGYVHKRAKAEYYRYDGLTLEGTHTWILPRGQFILNTLEYELDGYDGPDPAVSARTRRDQQLRYRITYGLPMAILVPMPWARPVTEHLSATTSFEQFRSLSNVTNYTYSNSKYNVLISKRWEF